MALKRINLNLSEELLKKIDLYAEGMGISRSSAISVLISTQLQQQDALTTMQLVIDKLNNEVDSKK